MEKKPGDKKIDLKQLTIGRRIEEELIEDSTKRESVTDRKKENLHRGREKIQDMSPGKASDLKSIMDVLKNEKDKLIDEMRSNFFLFWGKKWFLTYLF